MSRNLKPEILRECQIWCSVKDVESADVTSDSGVALSEPFEDSAAWA